MIRKVVPRTRITNIGPARTILAGNPIGLLLVLTYATNVQTTKRIKPPISRIGKVTLKTRIK